MDRKASAVALLAAFLLPAAPLALSAQQPAPSAPQPSGQQGAPPVQQPSTLDDKLEAGDEELGKPARNIINWNEYEFKYFTMRFGAGFLYDYVSFAQDDPSKEQFELRPDGKIRDSRVILSGRLKTKRPITWSAGILYDPPTDNLLIRQTGLLIDVPEISGQIFVGRQKEGFSLLKVMVGYAGWTMERQPISDATIPILADGVKWLGFSPKKQVLWNLGFYTDALSEGQSFSTYNHQVVGRFAWLPVMTERTVFHTGVSLRYGKPNNGALQLRSRPEVFPAPFFIDTGSFPAVNTRMAGFETYYRPGPFTAATEYFLQFANAPTVGNPFFHGGNAFVAWLPTGEIRVYNTRGGFFEEISPKRPVFQGGPGAWELVGNISYTDLNSGPVRGGTFWRITPMVNWYLSDNVRLEMAYGYGSLNRFDLVGKTQFFQTRIQLQL
jgi:phosphate-selective porin OprO/OprP